MARAADHRRLYDTTGYCFSDEKLLKTALTHSSYASEHRLGYDMNNERLEFIGDAFVDAVVGTELFSVQFAISRKTSPCKRTLESISVRFHRKPQDAARIYIQRYLEQGAGRETWEIDD